MGWFLGIRNLVPLADLPVGFFWGMDLPFLLFGIYSRVLWSGILINNFVLKLGHIRINNINKKLKILYNVYQQ